MIEKVNPKHPDKIADRIAGAIVDLAYREQRDPQIAVEVLIGHGHCYIIIETSVHLYNKDIRKIVDRIAGKTPTGESFEIEFIQKRQDKHLAENQQGGIRCGDNGIFKGMPITSEQKACTALARRLYDKYKSDGKYIIDGDKTVICQSNADSKEIRKEYPNAIINPLGDWTGGTDVDTGATNRKLGSDMGDSVTGGGLHGKDLSKADVSVNIYAHLEAQRLGKPVVFSCAIGDEFIDGKPYREIVEIAKEYVTDLGGFEKFAEWGLF